VGLILISGDSFSSVQVTVAIFPLFHLSLFCLGCRLKKLNDGWTAKTVAVCGGGSKEGEILVCQTVQLLSRNVVHNGDMISKPTNARQCMTVYGTHTHAHRIPPTCFGHLCSHLQGGALHRTDASK
jgi:hypothetical protein